MTKAIVTVVFRSPDPVEIEPGVFEYEYTKIENVGADIRNKTFSHSNGDSINMNTSMNIILSIIMSNDGTDRLNRISHVNYLGTLYTIDRIEGIYPPRVNVSLGKRETKSLDSLIGG